MLKHMRTYNTSKNTFMKHRDIRAYVTLGKTTVGKSDSF